MTRSTSDSPAPGLPRREFVALSGITLAATLLQGGPVMADPFQTSDFERLIPRDKKLRPEWVASLTARGASTVYKKSRGELRFIGMPIGGICAGGLYLRPAASPVPRRQRPACSPTTLPSA